MTAAVGYFHAVEHPNGFNNFLNKVTNNNNTVTKNNDLSKFTWDGNDS